MTMSSLPVRTGMRLFTALFTLIATASAHAAADANKPLDYAVRIPVTVQAGAPLQRLALPAQAMIASQSAGLADLRIFNGAGQPVAMALSNPASTQERASVTLKAMPILGNQAFGKQGQVSLRIEEQQGKRVVQVDTTGTSDAAAQKQIVGALFDARAVNEAVVGAALEVDLPEAQPVTFTIESSADLKTWEPLVDTVLFRAADSKDRLGGGQIDLPAVDLAGHYLRVNWRDAAGNPVPTVSVQGITLTTARKAANTARVTAAVAQPTLEDAHTIRFALPFATPVAAVRVQPADANILVPVRLLTRGDRSQPWTVLADSVVYNMSAAGKPQNSGAIELQGTSSREIKIEADRKTGGFATAPAISVAFDPAQIIFLANGAGPYTLAAGMNGAASAYLPVASLIPGYRAGQEDTLPKASAEAAGAPAAMITATSAGEGTPTRNLVLWAVLILGALLLGLMAWRLMKQNNQGNQNNPGEKP